MIGRVAHPAAKNKVEKRGKNQSLKIWPPKTTSQPSVHHKFTTKNHAKNAQSSATPLKNASKSAEKSAFTTPEKIPENYRPTAAVDTGICSTISIPNPCSAGTCVGVFVSSRIL